MMGRPLLVRLAFALVAAMAAGPAPAQPPSAEAAAVADDVLARNDWLALSNRCPASVMPGQQSLGYLNGKDCLPGQLKSCLSRCVSNDAGACYWLAEGLQEAHVAPQASEALFQRACHLGIVSGCTNRAAGMSKDQPDDPQAQACAAQTYTKACEADDPWACTMQALHLSRGIGLAQDRGLALKALEKSCKYGPEDPACAYGRRLMEAPLDTHPPTTERK